MPLCYVLKTFPDVGFELAETWKFNYGFADMSDQKQQDRIKGLTETPGPFSRTIPDSGCKWKESCEYNKMLYNALLTLDLTEDIYVLARPYPSKSWAWEKVSFPYRSVMLRAYPPKSWSWEKISFPYKSVMLRAYPSKSWSWGDISVPYKSRMLRAYPDENWDWDDISVPVRRQPLRRLSGSKWKKRRGKR